MTLPHDAHRSVLAKTHVTRPKRPPGLGACAEWPAATQEPGVPFTEVTVWKRLRLSCHSLEILGRGSPGLAFEEKPNKMLLCPPTAHFRFQPHISARRFRPLPLLPVSVGSAAAGFCVCCGWFRRAPGERTRDSLARLPVKATLRLGDATELHALCGLFRCGPGGLGPRLSRPAPRGPCPGALRVVAAAFASGLLTWSQGFPHPRMFWVPQASFLPLAASASPFPQGGCWRHPGQLVSGSLPTFRCSPGPVPVAFRAAAAGLYPGPETTTTRSLLPGLMTSSHCYFWNCRL